MAAFKVISLLISVCVVLASAGHLRFPDEDFMEMQIQTSGKHGLVGWFSGTDKATGEKKKIWFEPADKKKTISTKGYKDVSIHCEAEHRVELDYMGNTQFHFLNTGSGSSMSLYDNGTVKKDVERHTTYASLPADCPHCTGTYLCKEQIKDSKETPIQAHVEFDGK